MSDAPDAPAFIRRMDTVFNILSRLCFLVAGVALVVMTAIFAWLVFGRYVLNDTPTWVEQVSLLLVMVIAFSALPQASTKTRICPWFCSATSFHALSERSLW